MFGVEKSVVNFPCLSGMPAWRVNVKREIFFCFCFAIYGFVSHLPTSTSVRADRNCSAFGASRIPSSGTGTGAPSGMVVFMQTRRLSCVAWMSEMSEWTSCVRTWLRGVLVRFQSGCVDCHRSEMRQLEVGMTETVLGLPEVVKGTFTLQNVSRTFRHIYSRYLLIYVRPPCFFARKGHISVWEQFTTYSPLTRTSSKKTLDFRDRIIVGRIVYR